MKQLQLLFIFLCFAFLAKAQTYPVTVVPTIKQPAPIYFSNYADPSVINGPLQVQIILNDLSISNREIRLKTYFEGNGISFQSNAIVNGASPLFLEGGIPLVLNASEIAPYYEFTNTTGISANVYGQPIPEGSYEFCYEVYDAISGNRISQKTCATTYIFQNEPPFLVYPQNRAGIQEQNPQNIVFQWTPRHINVSNVEYELTLVEIWDNNIDPQAAFLSSRPVFTTTTRNTTYVYGPTDPLLLSNKRYAWRVKAKALQGAEEVGVFKNNGNSEIFSFILSTPCKTPQNVTHEVKGMREANIYWDDFTTDISEFTVRYREKGEGNQWFSSRSTANWVTLWDLRPGTVYEYQVAKKCELVDSDYSTVKSFTTFIAEDESGLYNCGIPPAIDIATQEPLAELKKGDVFRAGDFPVKVQEVSGNNGRFTGKGYVTIPYLKSVKVAVEFTNVFVNTDSQLAEGMVITKYDPSMKNILDVDEAVNDVTDALEAVLQLGNSITDLFKQREKELNNLHQLQEALTNETITQEEFDKGVEQIGINIKAIDEQINGRVIDKIVNSPYATEEEKKEAKDLKLSQDLVSKDTDVDKELANQKSASERLNEIATAVKERAVEDTDKEIAFEYFEIFDDLIQTDQPTITYISPAGIPVILPKNATPHFLKENDLKVPYGVLSGFTLNDSIYNGYHKEGKFTGYKTSKGKAPYQFSKPTSTKVVATIIQRIPYLDCNYFVVKGAYQATSINTTGENDLINKLSFTSELELVKDEKLALYNECLPDISRLAYNEYLWGYYNFYGRGGFLRFTQAENGELTYLYTVPEGENGSMVGWQYYTESKKWYLFNEPPRGCLSCDLYFLFGAIFSKDAGHIALDVAGMVPGLGEVFDATNGVWYTVEGEYGNAAISFASTIPLVYVTTVKNIGYAVKLADGTYQVIKFSSKEAKSLIKTLKTLNLDADALKLLNKDLTDKTFATAIKHNPELLEAWKLLYNAGKKRLRKNKNTLTSIVELRKSVAYNTLGLSDEILTSIEGSQNLAYIDIINSLQKFGNEVSSKSIKIENFSYVLSDLKSGHRFGEGAEWTIRYLGDNANDFNRKSLKFEERLKAGENIRRVDVVNISNPRNNIFYEFKSVKDVPPGHFAEQFIKDLEIANNLDQIKWLFDGRKAPPNFKENMLKAIDELPLTDKLARKFLEGELNPTPIKLKQEIIYQFEDIFKLNK